MTTFAENTSQTAVYFKTLALKNVRCFKGEHTIDFSNGDGKPTQWTVILGNNNTGKTTVLRALGDMNRYEASKFDKVFKDLEGDIFEFTNDADIFKLINENDGQIEIKFTGFKNDLLPIHSGNNEYYHNFFGLIKRDGLHFSASVNSEITKLNLIGYGTSRFMSNNGVSEDSTAGLFDNKTELLNAEKWLIDLHVAKTAKFIGAEARYKQVMNVLCNGLLPDVTRIHIKTIPDKSSYETFPVFLTSYGLVRLQDLGYGYQATLAWVADLAKRMFDRYPDLENPLHGPAVVLVDEIDLHLHPEWQRKIIKYLSDLFPHTQFIVTAHSPLIVQSAKDVNVIMLEKDDDESKGINIRQRFGSFQGWTIDEILSELMNLGERTRSDRYLDLMAAFEDAVLDNDYEKAQTACDELYTILSPSSYQRKVLQIQMSSLMPVAI
jgi:AAA domain, putative AbiEii toxin, Type IV TA system